MIGSDGGGGAAAVCVADHCTPRMHSAICKRNAKHQVPHQITHTSNTRTNTPQRAPKRKRKRSVKRAVASATSFGGLPTCMDYALTKNTGEDVVDAGFLHERFTPAGHGIVGGSGGGRGRGAGGEGGAFAARDALVVATGHKVFSLANADGDDE